jgi:hypothetical protein
MLGGIGEMGGGVEFGGEKKLAKLGVGGAVEGAADVGGEEGADGGHGDGDDGDHAHRDGDGEGGFGGRDACR